VQVTFAAQDYTEEARKNVLEVLLPFYLSKLNSIAEENNGYLACKRFTWADIYFASLSRLVVYVIKDQDLYQKYPALRKVIDIVESNDKIKKWIAERPSSHY
jgi:glutathione S-transferase